MWNTRSLPRCVGTCLVRWGPWVLTRCQGSRCAAARVFSPHHEDSCIRCCVLPAPRCRVCNWVGNSSAEFDTGGFRLRKMGLIFLRGGSDCATLNSSNIVDETTPLFCSFLKSSTSSWFGPMFLIVHEASEPDSLDGKPSPILHT